MHSLQQKIRVILRVVLNSRAFFFGGWVLAFLSSFIWRLSHSEWMALSNQTAASACFVDNELNDMTMAAVTGRKQLRIMIPYSGSDENFHKMGEPYMIGVDNYYRKFEIKHNIKIQLLHVIDNKERYNKYDQYSRLKCNVYESVITPLTDLSNYRWCN